jgi:hypothetical protein
MARLRMEPLRGIPPANLLESDAHAGRFFVILFTTKSTKEILTGSAPARSAEFVQNCLTRRQRDAEMFTVSLAPNGSLRDQPSLLALAGLWNVLRSAYAEASADKVVHKIAVA